MFYNDNAERRGGKCIYKQLYLLVKCKSSAGSISGLIREKERKREEGISKGED